MHSEELLKAFQALDTESKGHLTIDEAKNFFTRHGEAFAQVCKRYHRKIELEFNTHYFLNVHEEVLSFRYHSLFISGRNR